MADKNSIVSLRHVVIIIGIVIALYIVTTINTPEEPYDLHKSCYDKCINVDQPFSECMTKCTELGDQPYN